MLKPKFIAPKLSWQQQVTILISFNQSLVDSDVMEQFKNEQKYHLNKMVTDLKKMNKVEESKKILKHIADAPMLNFESEELFIDSMMAFEKSQHEHQALLVGQPVDIIPDVDKYKEHGSKVFTAITQHSSFDVAIYIKVNQEIRQLAEDLLAKITD